MADTTKRTQAGPLPVSQRVKTISAALMFLGIVTFAFMLMRDKDRAWHGYLVGYFYFFILAIGGLFFTAIHHATNAGWSVNVRRICESFAAFMPAAFVGGVVLIFGAHSLFEWMNVKEVQEDHLLSHKAAYLNPTFFIIRTVVFFALWLWFSKKIVGFSVKQDETGDESYTRRAVPWSIAFLLVFALSFSLYAVDVIMSLQPHWFSTIFGVYTFAGLFQSTIAAMILVVIYCLRKGLLTGYVNENHLHDLGKYLFAFTVFWAYIAYSQYMLIWYANLPEETTFFLARSEGAWALVSGSLILFKFVVPFLALLPRWAKRSQPHLIAISLLILVMQYVDIYWLVFPNLSSKEVIFGLPEILIWGGFAGAFIFIVTRFLGRHPIVPIKDPRIHESLHHHVVY